MKKFFALAAVVALALTSCVTTTEIPDPAGEISFEAFNFKAQSRADVYGPIVGTAYPETEHFGVYAFISTDAVNNYMNNAEILLDDVELVKDGAWRSINPRYYWPKGGTLTFVAYSPYVENNAPSADRTTGISFTAYTTTANLDEQIDLMATDLIPEVANYREDAVPVVFNHLLSQVCFQVNTEVTSDVATVTLEELTLTNVLPTGDYAEGAWSNVRGAALTFEYLPGIDDKQEVNGTATAVKKAAIVIPQTLAKAEAVNNIKVSYTFSIKYAGTGATDVVNGTYELKDATTAWEKGHKYTYTITYGTSDEITFTPSIEEDWTAGEGGSITVG